MGGWLGSAWRWCPVEGRDTLDIYFLFIFLVSIVYVHWLWIYSQLGLPLKSTSLLSRNLLLQYYNGGSKGYGVMCDCSRYLLAADFLLQHPNRESRYALAIMYV